MKNKFNLFALLSVFFLANCKSIPCVPKSHFVYLISEAEIDGKNLNFSFTNNSTEEVKSFTIYVELESSENSSDYSNFCNIEKRIEGPVGSMERIDFSLNLDEFSFSGKEDSEIEELILNQGIFIRRIYAKEIAFNGDLLWTDKYGNWSF